MRYGQRPMGGQGHRGTMPASTIPSKTSIGTNTNKDSSLASLSQIIAMAMTYRRLGFVFLSMPLVCVFSPILTNVLLRALNYVTGGQDIGLPFLGVMLCCSWAWKRERDRFAPSLEALQKSQQTDRTLLPLVIFLSLRLFLCLLPIPKQDNIVAGGGDGEGALLLFEAVTAS